MQLNKQKSSQLVRITFIHMHIYYLHILCKPKAAVVRHQKSEHRFPVYQSQRFPNIEFIN